ncbi:hypothetical protein [Agreia bicolorata]|uniref:hypothetical protein n=1 Tax=Agreia bicolorata TaxID=110935 RepID=UPI00111687E7|nr:hypothetical protein [Agreia bicolorata]
MRKPVDGSVANRIVTSKLLSKRLMAARSNHGAERLPAAAAQNRTQKFLISPSRFTTIRISHPGSLILPALPDAGIR